MESWGHSPQSAQVGHRSRVLSLIDEEEGQGCEDSWTKKNRKNQIINTNPDFQSKNKAPSPFDPKEKVKGSIIFVTRRCTRE